MERIKVRIKTWEEMEKEFGLDEDGDIDTRPFFTEEMEDSMPTSRIINVNKDTNGYFNWEDTTGCQWRISADMIAEYLPTEIETDALDIEKTQDEDYIENLEFENRMFAEFLSGLGYSNEQISDIAMMGAGFNQTNSGD